MGYIDITLNGSDEASMAEDHVCKAIAASLLKELDNEPGPYNTPGCVNVALIIDERLIPGQFNVDYSEPLKDVASKAYKKLAVLLELAKGIEVERWSGGAERKKNCIETYAHLLHRLAVFLKWNKVDKKDV